MAYRRCCRLTFTKRLAVSFKRLTKIASLVQCSLKFNAESKYFLPKRPLGRKYIDSPLLPLPSSRNLQRVNSLSCNSKSVSIRDH